MPGRYFENSLGDYASGSAVAPDEARLKKRILSIVDDLIKVFPPVPRNPTTERDYASGSAVAPDEARLKKRILSIVDDLIKVFPPVPRNPTTESKTDGSLYVGLAGMAFSLWYAASSGLFPEHNARFLQTAKMYMEITLGKLSQKSVDRFDEVAFLLGNVGNYLTSAFVYDALGENDNTRRMLQRMNQASSICEPIKFQKHGSDELFVGRAGYLTAVQSVIRILKKGSPVDPSVRQKLSETILQSGLTLNSPFRSPSHSTLMYAYYGDEYLGIGHGLSGILLALLNEPSVLCNPESLQQVRQSVEFLIRTQTPSGNFEPSTDELVKRPPVEHELVHWCHGAPGVIHLLAKAYLVYKDPKYLQACERAAQLIWERGLLKKGPGICHGVAGNAYAFLVMYRLTANVAYYYRALQFAEFIFTKDFQLNARTPDEPWSLFEGWAGTVCFLVDLLQPKKAEFPFAHVFD